MKVYITKYALTDGIVECEARATCRPPMIVAEYGGPHTGYYMHGGEWHNCRADAVAKAEAMRVRKLASLRKQIARLEALRFDP